MEPPIKMNPTQALGLLHNIAESTPMTGPQRDRAREAAQVLKLALDSVPILDLGEKDAKD